jgi:hypothetical protein
MHHTRVPKVVVDHGKVCKGSLRPCKERSKILVERGKLLKEARLGVSLGEQLKLPQRRRRNHRVDDFKFQQINHCVHPLVCLIVILLIYLFFDLLGCMCGCA